jgi:hypothetical protein
MHRRDVARTLLASAAGAGQVAAAALSGVRPGDPAEIPPTSAEVSAGILPSGKSYPPGNPYRYGAVGNGSADDYTAVRNADIVCAASNLVLTIPGGVFSIGTSHSFASTVSMGGGVFTGAGTLTFPAAFIAAPYYCFDCLVGQLKCEVVYAEWFGARQSNATPKSTRVSVASKAWNTWPSFIVGSKYKVNQNYGDTAFLAAQKPFQDTDTWDFIAIQRALWSTCLDTTLRGEVRLFAGTYYLSQAVRYVGLMSSTLRGAGRTKTALKYENHLISRTVATSAGTVKPVLNFYVVGTDSTYIADLAVCGPFGYAFAGDLYLIVVQGSNGIVFDNLWVTTGDVGLYFEHGSNDCEVRGSTFEYCAAGIRGYDAPTWAKVTNCSVWPGARSPVGIVFVGYAFLNACLLVCLHVPFELGLGSHVAGTTLIQEKTGYRTTIDGRTVSRRLSIPAGASVGVLQAALPEQGMVTTRMRVGGSVHGVGAAGFIRELAWHADGGAPVPTVIQALMPFGNPRAAALVADDIAASGNAFILRIVNRGTEAMNYLCDVTVQLEGSDYVLSGLG